MEALSPSAVAWRVGRADSWLAFPVVLCGLLLLAGVDGVVFNANPVVFLFNFIIF